MDQNIPVLAKKVWQMVRIAFFMIRKGISKKRLLLDLNLMMKKGKRKITEKNDINSLISSLQLHQDGFNGLREYEFSCNNTPLYNQYFTKKRGKPQQNYMPSPLIAFAIEEDKDSITAVNKVLEKMLSHTNNGRQIRVTDSPFPLRNSEEDSGVDEAAEEFIQRFYSQLKHQAY